MNTFGYGNSGEPVSPIDHLIQKATAYGLIGPDWSLNMEICDYINSKPDGAETASKSLLKRIKTGNPEVIQLALTVIEAAVKNCSTKLHIQIAKLDFLNEIAALTDGSQGKKVEKQAITLIQQWGMAFAEYRDQLFTFHDTYMRLKMKGIQFPPTDSEVPVFTPPPTHDSTISLKSGSTHGNLEEEFRKLKADLKVVSDKISNCRHLMTTEETEELADEREFLELCRPRLNTLIEAGIAGKLDEDTLCLCLKVNDELVKVLDATPSGTETMDLIDLSPLNKGMKNVSLENASLVDSDFDSFALSNSKRGEKKQAYASLGSKSAYAPASTAPGSMSSYTPAPAPGTMWNHPSISSGSSSNAVSSSSLINHERSNMSSSSLNSNNDLNFSSSRENQNAFPPTLPSSQQYTPDDHKDLPSPPLSYGNSASVPAPYHFNSTSSTAFSETSQDESFGQFLENKNE